MITKHEYYVGGLSLVWSMGLIRYAEKQGMIVDRDKYIETDLSSIGL